MNEKELKEIDRKVSAYRKRLLVLAKKESQYSIEAIDKEIKKVFKEYGNQYISKGAVSIFVAQALNVDIENYLRIHRKIETRIVTARMGEDAYLEMMTGQGYRLKVVRKKPKNECHG
jgi:hypothetical protein